MRFLQLFAKQPSSKQRAMESATTVDDKNVISNRWLYSFLSDFRKKIPREIRDGVYEYLLDKPTIDAMKIIENRNLCNLKDGNEILRSGITGGLPFMNRSLVPACVTSEIIEIFYRLHHEPKLSGPYQINLLRLDVFGYGVKPAEVHIPALKLEYSLVGRSQSQHTTDLSRFLSPTFKVRRNFSLYIELVTTPSDGATQLASDLTALRSLFTQSAIKTLKIVVAINCCHHGDAMRLTTDITKHLVSDKDFSFESDGWYCLFFTNQLLVEFCRLIHSGRNVSRT